MWRVPWTDGNMGRKNWRQAFVFPPVGGAVGVRMLSIARHRAERREIVTEILRQRVRG